MGKDITNDNTSVNENDTDNSNEILDENATEEPYPNPEQVQEEAQEQAQEQNQELHKEPKKRKSALPVILSVLVVLVLAAIISWAAINNKGRNDLYDKAESSAPMLETVQTEEIVNEITENETTWKKGWVRYNDGIYQYNEDILTFLVMGIDKKGEAEAVESGIKGGQADLIILAVFNPHTKSTSLITINRNTMTEIDVYDEKGEYVGSGQGQICLQHGYGDGAELSCERMKKAVSNLFYNLPIHGYFSINMGAIEEINSAVGGVTLTLEEDFYGDNGKQKVTIPKGEQTLTDAQAHAYIRYRDHSEFDSATTRLNRQKKYIAAFLSKLKAETSKDITAPIKVYNELSPYIVTDITTGEMTYIVSNMYNYQFDFDNIYSLEGTTAVGKTEHEEFNYNPDQLYDMIIEIFYEKVE